MKHLKKHDLKGEVIAVTGAVAGASVGSIAGPPGMVAGALIGGIIGGVAGHAMDNEDVREALHDEDLDRAIGVSGGDLGAASPDQPPARVGAYSIASSGGAVSTGRTSDGPIPPDDE